MNGLEQVQKALEIMNSCESREAFKEIDPDYGHVIMDCISNIVPKKRIEFIEFLDRGGEGGLLIGLDEDSRYCVAKVGLGHLQKRGKRDKHIRSFSIRAKAEEEARNTFQDRFLRGANIQECVCRQINRDFGVVPLVYKIIKYPFPAVVMECIDAEDSLHWASMQKEKGKLNLYLKLLKLVQQIHEIPVIHSDIKAANVLVNAEHKPVLIDFSLAKNLLERRSITNKHFAIDSNGASPKLKKFRAENRTFPDDVFSLGELMLVLIAGYVPNYELGEQEILAPRKLHPRLLDIYRRATEKKEQKRYQTVDPLIKDIEIHIAEIEKENVTEIVFDYDEEEKERLVKELPDGELIWMQYLAMREIAKVMKYGNL